MLFSGFSSPLTQKFSKIPQLLGLCPRPHSTLLISFLKNGWCIKLYFEFDCLDCFSPIFASPTEKLFNFCSPSGKLFPRLWWFVEEPFSKMYANRLPVFIISFLPFATLLQFLGYVPAHHFLAQPQEQNKFESFVNFVLNKYQLPL